MGRDRFIRIQRLWITPAAVEVLNIAECKRPTQKHQKGTTTCVFLRNHARHNVSLRCPDALRKVNGYVLVGKILIS